MLGALHSRWMLCSLLRATACCDSMECSLALVRLEPAVADLVDCSTVLVLHCSSTGLVACPIGSRRLVGAFWLPAWQLCHG